MHIKSKKAQYYGKLQTEHTRPLFTRGFWYALFSLFVPGTGIANNIFVSPPRSARILLTLRLSWAILYEVTKISNFPSSPPTNFDVSKKFKAARFGVHGRKVLQSTEVGKERAALIEQVQL